MDIAGQKKNTQTKLNHGPYRIEDETECCFSPTLIVVTGRRTTKPTAEGGKKNGISLPSPNTSQGNKNRRGETIYMGGKTSRRIKEKDYLTAVVFGLSRRERPRKRES